MDDRAKQGVVRISKRGEAMPASPIRRLVPFADQARARGIHVHSLNIGQPDIATPRNMIEAYQKYEEQVLAYGPSEGLPELREAVAAYYRDHGLEVRKEQVHITVGGSEALVFAMAAVADPGEEIIAIEPFYANYAGFATQLGVKVATILARAEDGYHLPPDEAFEAAINPKTRAIVFTSPGNPTGTVYTEAEMKRLGGLAEKHGLYLISDEVYREFAYDGVKVTSALSLPCANDRVIVIDSVSKRYSACGARVGCTITRNPALASAFTRMCFARLCPATVDQIAAIAAYQTPKSYFDAVVAEYTRRRDTLVDGLNAIPGVHTHRPEGAFYTMVTLPIDDIDRFAEWMLSDFSHQGETVMMAPGTGFYGTPGLGKHEARIAYVLKVPALMRSIEVLRAALAAYKA
jgi:aspartate aminotransferase